MVALLLEVGESQDVTYPSTFAAVPTADTTNFGFRNGRIAFLNDVMTPIWDYFTR